MMAGKKDDDDSAYLIEYTGIGNSVKVTAMDPRTLVEVSVIGDAKLSQRDLATLAVRKLRYMIARKNKA